MTKLKNINPTIRDIINHKSTVFDIVKNNEKQETFEVKNDFDPIHPVKITITTSDQYSLRKRFIQGYIGENKVVEIFIDNVERKPNVTLFSPPSSSCFNLVSQYVKCYKLAIDQTDNIISLFTSTRNNK